MRMREIEFPDQRPIDSYGPGGFRIGEVWHDGAQIVSPEGVAPLETPLSPERLAPLVRMAPDIDVVLIGQGPEIAPLPRNIRVLLEEAGIGVEIMATPSACRTYNVLLAEERRVAAVLLPV
jgi:uncharacterized protein